MISSSFMRANHLINREGNMKKFRTYQLAINFYKNASKLKLNNPFRDQYQRALLSIVLNLAEGSGKLTMKDRRRFYSISLGSMREVQAILEINNATHLEIVADTVAAHIYRLCQRCQ